MNEQNPIIKLKIIKHKFTIYFYWTNSLYANENKIIFFLRD